MKRVMEEHMSQEHGPFFVYVLQSIPTGRFYIGQTDRLISRFDQHMAGKVRSTKAYRPWRMLYIETYSTRAEAIKREHELKRKKSALSIMRVVGKGYAAMDMVVPHEYADRGR